MFKLMRVLVVALTIVSAGFAFGDIRLQGAGATFPNPLYQKWVSAFGSAHPSLRVDYQSIGSGGGIKGITEKTLDFAGSDAPMSKKEKEAAGAPVVHIPTCAGAVVSAYNLPQFSGELKLTGPVLADIYMGKISKWNDPRLKEINPGANLPDLAITPVYRTDGSGTTFVFTNYLATQSEGFTNAVGIAKAVKWPVGQGGKGNEGVTAAVQQTSGGIGYIELNYAEANHIPFASVKNKSGAFVKATPQSVSAAGEVAAANMKESLAVALWNQEGEAVYPIAAFTYIIVYQDLSYLKDESKAAALVTFLKWALTDGQKSAAELSYAPLSPAVQSKAVQAIENLRFNGGAVNMATIK